MTPEPGVKGGPEPAVGTEEEAAHPPIDLLVSGTCVWGGGVHGTMWSRKVVGGCWEEKAAEGLVGLGITPNRSPQWKPGPLFPTPNPDPVPAPETQAGPALGVTAPLQVLKTHRRSLSIALCDGAGRSPRG